MVTDRLVPFAVCWLATTALWNAILVFESRLAPLGAVLALAVHAAILGAAIALCHADRDAGYVVPVVVATCIVLGIASTALFAVVGGDGDAVAFIHLTLYVATALFFAWGWAATLVLLVGTVVPWLVVLPFMTFYVPSIDLAAAIVIGSGLSLATAEGYARSFRASYAHRRREERGKRALQASRDASRAVAEKAEVARAEAEAATRAKDEFLATVSHELRSPLNAILTWAHMLRGGLIDADEARGAVDIIERNARSQRRLIEDLLDVSRIVSGQLRLDRATVELRAVVAALAESARGAAEAKGVGIDVRLPDEPTAVRGDASRLHQVFENLVSNAVKFTPAGGRVTIELARSGSHATTTVRDTGIGIAREVLPHVFERFHQADSSTTRRHGGLGLGLAIARDLVEVHGGAIDVTSPGEGRGATFTVTLPLDPSTRSLPAPAEHRLLRFDGALDLARVRVLVVEDERDARTFLTTLLSRCGADVTPVASVREALADISAQPPDVLISDLAMPDEDGFDLIREVRSMEGGRGTRVPAIAVTALARPEDRARAIAAGYDVHLAKPVEPHEVVAVVARAVRDAVPG